MTLEPRMPEGLSPIEVGRELHEHTSEPHHPDGGSRHSRTVQIGEALLLSLVTIAAAWSGYAAAKWNTESRLELAQAATLRNLATRADLSALSTRNFDSSTFTAWFTAFTLEDPQKQAVAERRFRPEFKVAFDAWMATDPFHNPRRGGRRRLHPDHGVLGRGAVPGRDRQHLQAAHDPLRPHRYRIAAAPARHRATTASAWDPRLTTSSLPARTGQPGFIG
jgi:hypothetical protein